MKLHIIDTLTNKLPDLERIAKKEEWAKALTWSNVDCFAIDQEGILILLDSCGNYVCCPGNRFKVTISQEL